MLVVVLKASEKGLQGVQERERELGGYSLMIPVETS
jgi:hypothetical protein